MNESRKKITETIIIILPKVQQINKLYSINKCSINVDLYATIYKEIKPWDEFITKKCTVSIQKITIYIYMNLYIYIYVHEDEHKMKKKKIFVS